MGDCTGQVDALKPILTIAQVRMMSFLHGEQYPACLVSPEQSAQQLAQLKVDMHKAFTYSEGKAALCLSQHFFYILTDVGLSQHFLILTDIGLSLHFLL